MNTINDCVEWASARLAGSDAYFGHGCDNPRDEAIWAALHVTGLMDREYEEVESSPITQQELSAVRELIEKRIETRQPLAYLIQEAWFAGYSFYIDERAIVPRSHIGDLIQDGLKPWINFESSSRALDLCCGSGCIAIALALHFPNLKVDASDIEPAALEVAKINIDRYAADDRVGLVQSDLFEKLPDCQYDLIASNPPYIPTPELSGLPTEYHYEPRMAFAGGDDGLEIVNRILAKASNHLTDSGYLLIELGGYASSLEDSYPDFPFLWLTSRGEESVVALLSRQDLESFQFHANR